MDAKDWHFPMACPLCQRVTAIPYRALTLEEELKLELRCRACHHEWVITAPHPVMFRRKPDRRSERVL